jgi:autotransporter-associated beta strand protein
VRQDGSGVTSLTGVNTYTGATTIANGTVLINSGSSLGANTGTFGPVTINSGATLDLSGETTGALTFNAKPFFIAGAGVGGIGAIYNNGPAAQSTNGSLEVVTLTGDATINATQRLDLRGGTPFLDLSGHTLTIIGGNQFSFFTGTITPGTIDVQAGTFSIQQGASADGNGQVILENNSRMAFNNASTAFARPIKGNGNVTLFNSTTSSTVASPVSLNGTLSFAGSTASTVLTLQGNISETTRSSVTVNNTNTPTPSVLLAGNNSYTGGTTITAGILQAGSDTALGAGQGPLIMNGTATLSGTLDLNGHSVTTGSLGGAADPTSAFGTITNTAAGPATLTMNGAAAPPAFAGVIQNGTGPVSLVKGGGGTSILSGANTYTGTTTVKQGILAAGAANAIASTSNLILSGGTFSTGGFNLALGTVQLTATSGIDLGNAASKLNFATSSSLSWTSGAVLRVYDWDGTQAGGGTDQLVVGSSNSGLTAAQLSQIRFVGHATGASILPSGEIVPASTAVVASPGDFTRDGHVNGADVTAMLSALSDLNAYKAANSLTNDTFLDIGDLNGDLVVGNSDLQSLLTLLAGGHGSGAGSGTAAVPEPAGLTLGVAGAIVLLVLLPRRRRVFSFFPPPPPPPGFRRDRFAIESRCLTASAFFGDEQEARNAGNQE